MRLSNSTLRKLADNGVKVPKYDRCKLTPGILHIGVSNFHRAHQAGYMDDLLDKEFENHKEWGIVGASLRSEEKREMLKEQDCLQTLVSREGDDVNVRVLGCMIDYLPVLVDAILEALEDESIKIVSLTITEGGYFLNDGELDKENEQIKADIENPDKPETVFGILCKAIKNRKENNQEMFTIMSCDNIPHNGNVVRSVMVGLAKEQDESLASFIEENVQFPNNMVDRITPSLTEDDQNFLKEKYDIEDWKPVFCEPYRRWVLEDKFNGGKRPAWEKLESVSFVDDIKPYEFRKLRILNGSHATLCFPSALLGVEYVHKALKHKTIRPFLDCVQKTEIIPTVPTGLPDMTPDEFWESVSERFSNPAMMDTIERQCFDGASRQAQFIIPVIRDNLDAKRSVEGLALVSALWARYCEGKTESGDEIEENDPQWERLNKTAQSAKDDAKIWLEELSDVYGDLSENSTFSEAFEKAMNSLHKNGVEATLNDYVSTHRNDKAAPQ
jgi:mannitol 2-dehydrogenase